MSILLTAFLVLAGLPFDDLDRVAFTGRVTDLAGRVVVGVRITARRAESGAEYLVSSDGRGEYRLINLPPGLYELRAEAAGFGTVVSRPMTGAGGEMVRFDFTLGPVRFAEVMEVVGRDAAIRVDPTRTVVGTTIGSEEIERLPVESRNPLDLVHTVPVAAAPGLSDRELAEGDRQVVYRRTPLENGIFSLAGGMPFSNNVTIEGLDNNDDREGRERFIPALAGVEEVQVIANQFAAEYGRATGGRVNLRLRGGSSRRHGEIFNYYRDARLNANGFFRNADPARARRVPFFNHNPGVTFGGPAGRLGFFVAFEYDYINDRAEIAALVPVGQNPRFGLPAPNGPRVSADLGFFDLSLRTPRRSQTFQNRMEIETRRGHRIGGLVTLARSGDQRSFPGGRRMADTIRQTGRGSDSWSVSDQWTISERLFNSLRLQWSRLGPVDGPAGESRGAPVVLIEIDDPRGKEAGLDDRSGTLVAGASNLGGMERRESRWQVQETLTVARGDHTLRSGFDLHSIDSRYADLTDSSGTWSFDSVSDFLASRPARYVQRFGTGSKVGNLYGGIFWQDDWRRRRGMTIGYGLRWERESVVDDRNNFGPRLSLALDPTGSGRGVIRLGGGIFYHRAMLRTVDDFRLTSQRRTFDTENAGAALWLPRLVFPHRLSQDDPELAAVLVAESGFRRQLAPGLRLPESRQLTAGVDRELGRRARIELQYVHHHGAYLWRESNINLPVLPAGYQDWGAFLLELELPNRPDPLTGRRPYPGSADLIRFSTSSAASETVRETGRTVITYGLNSPSTSNATNGRRTALAAINRYRRQPDLTQVEELQARGQSRYDGLTVSLSGFGLRVGYTLSRTVDDGVVNTSSPLVAGDFRRERSLSLLDARHRFVVSGHRQLPRRLGGLAIGAVLQLTSGRPFNIGINGNDRNLDDVGNDRPDFSGRLDQIGWRRPSAALTSSQVDDFSLPMIGTVGNLPRNAGLGPAMHTLNVRVSRAIGLGAGLKAQVLAEAFNPLNATVFSFGAEFVDYVPGRAGSFLTPRRTIKPRTLRLGLRLSF